MIKRGSFVFSKATAVKLVFWNLQVCKKFWYLFLRDLWPLLQKFYSWRGPGHLALSGHFTYSFYLSKIPNLRSFGNSWANSRTRSLIHCFTGDESKLFCKVARYYFQDFLIICLLQYAPAKFRNIIFMIFW